MESESGLKIEGKFYALPFEEVLEGLTGKQTVMLEDYLGGWGNLNFENPNTRSVVVLVWLAKHHAGEETTLDAIEDMKGLVFGGAVEEVDVRPPPVDTDSSQVTTETSGPLGSLAVTSATG